MMEPTCIDLRPWADRHRFRWRWEESRQLGNEDPFYVEVLCKYGMIYPKGGNILLAYSSAGMKQRIRREIEGAEHHQWDGHAEVFRFPAEKLDEVAAILQPRKRRTLDPDKARAIGKGTFYGAQSGKTGPKSSPDDK
jgi:hypothetical protein